MDLGPAARRLADLVRHVGDDALGRPTPCPAYTVGDLLDHIGGLSLAFTAAARKTPLDGGPTGDASALGVDWRDRIPAALDALADAWRDPEAWDGMTAAGGIDLPGGVAGLVALDELVVHGWDLARATGQPYEPDPAALDAVHGFLAASVTPDAPPPPDSPFGPPVPVADDAPLLDRVVALTGRDPAWTLTNRA